MRNYKISRLGCTALFLLLAILPGDDLFAGGEELATTSDGNGTVSEESGATQSLGIGKFAALPFHVSVSVRGGFDDNVPTAGSSGRQGSTFANVNLAGTYDFGSPRMAINLQTNGGITYYSDSPDGITYDFNPNLNFSITYKVNPRLTLSETTYAAYQNQPDFQYNAGTNRRSGSYFYATNKFSAAYRWRPRFSTVTSYTLAVVQYDDAATGRFENRVEHTFGNEFRFLVWPTTSVIAEYRLALLDYEDTLRNSTSNFFLGGLDHSFSPRFSISTRAGVEVRSYDTFGSRADPYFEGSLNYALGPHLSLAWNNRYSIEEPDVPGSQARTTFRTSLTGSYKITPRITASLTAFYEHDVNDPSIVFIFVQPGFIEDSLSLSLALRYAVNHTWGAELGWDFTNVASDEAFREYYRNRFYGGINFAF